MAKSKIFKKKRKFSKPIYFEILKAGIYVFIIVVRAQIYGPTLHLTYLT